MPNLVALLDIPFGAPALSVHLSKNLTLSLGRGWRSAPGEVAFDCRAAPGEVAFDCRAAPGEVAPHRQRPYKPKQACAAWRKPVSDFMVELIGIEPTTS